MQWPNLIGSLDSQAVNVYEMLTGVYWKFVQILKIALAIAIIARRVRTAAGVVVGYKVTSRSSQSVANASASDAYANRSRKRVVWNQRSAYSVLNFQKAGRPASSADFQRESYGAWELLRCQNVSNQTDRVVATQDDLFWLPYVAFRRCSLREVDQDPAQDIGEAAYRCA